MKKLYYFLVACIAVMSLGACSLKEDDDFDVDSTARSEENIESVRKALQGSANGWLMEYYGNLNFGGYNVMVKFEDNQATVASEKWGSSHHAGLDADGNIITATSHFKIEQSMGTVLSFDGYNEILHYYAMPNNPDYSYDPSEGLSGDFEFRVMKVTQDSIILRGKKNNARIVMTPIPEGKDWAEYINEAKDTENFMMSSSYTLTGDDYKDTIEVKVTNNGRYRCLIFSYVDTLDQKQTVAAPYIVKKDGYFFYYPVEVNGVTLDGLSRGETSDYFLFRNNANLRLDSYLPTIAEQLTTTTWYLRYSDLGAYATPQWSTLLTKLKTAGKNKDEVKIYTATLGPSSEGKLVASLRTSTDQPYWGFNVTANEAGDEVTIKAANKVNNKSGLEYYNKLGWKAAMAPIFGHTFKLSCDDQRRPTYIKMSDTKNADNVITLFVTPSYFMNSSYYLDD